MEPKNYIIEEPGNEPVVVYNLPESEDALEFECAYRFFENRQHDHHAMQWDGESRNPWATYLRERYYPRGFQPVDAGSPYARKPELATPAAMTMVQRMTGLLLGTDPTIGMVVSDDSQAMLRAVYDAAALCLPFAQGRNMAGGGGATILIPCIVGGTPCVTVGRPSEFKVLAWSDKEQWQPSRIVKQTLVKRWVRDHYGNREEKEFWSTTEWNETLCLYYQLVPKDWPKDKPIPLDSNKPAYAHGAGRCPATWYKNSETDKLYGATDFTGLEPRLDAIDRLGTHLYTAIGKNCDPTVFQADEEGTRRRHLISKRGRGVIAQLSEKGTLGALEIAGTSLEVTYKFWRGLQDDTYALADCVRVTPDTAGVFKSGEAIRLLWRSAEVRARWLWPPLEKAIRRVLECIFSMARTFGVSSYEAPVAGSIILPSRVIPAPRPMAKPRASVPPEADPAASAAPSGPIPTLAPPADEKPAPTLQAHKVGPFGFIEIKAGAYFPKTPTERASDITAVQAASGGAKIVSQETAVEEAAKSLGLDPDEELRRVHEEEERGAANAAAIAGAGAAAPPPKAKPGEEPPPAEGDPEAD